MSEYAPLRDAFHDINKLLIDKQQWDAEHEARTQDQGIKRMMMESQLQDQALQRKKLQLDAKENELKMRPAEVNIHDYVPNNEHTQKMLYDTDPNLQINLAKVWGGSTIDRVTGKVMGDDGNPIIMPTFEKGLKSVAAQSLIHGAFDPDVMISANLGAIDRGIDERKQALSELAKLPINAQKMGNIRGEIAKLNAQKEEHIKMRDDPDSRIGLLQKQLAVASGFASQAVAQGAGPELIKLFVNQQDNITKQIITWQTHKFDIAKTKGDKDAQRVPQLMHAVLLDPQDPSKVLQTVQIGVPKVTQGMLPENIDPRLKGWVWSDQAAFNKPEKSRGTKEDKMTDSTEISISKLLASNYGTPSADNTTTLIYPEQAFAEKMAQKIFSGKMAELRAKHDKIDWNAISPTMLKEESIVKQKEHLDFYYAEQAKKDQIAQLVRSIPNLTAAQKQEKLKSELDIYNKNMKELDTMMYKEYGGLPDPTFNPFLQKDKRGS
jgi:hypothetical protein